VAGARQPRLKGPTGPAGERGHAEEATAKSTAEPSEEEIWDLFAADLGDCDGRLAALGADLDRDGPRLHRLVHRLVG
jgi:hypothetical protein